MRRPKRFWKLSKPFCDKEQTMDTSRFPELIKDIYRAVNELEEMFTDADGHKRHFTPDGHMVGSIGEVLAAYHYGIELFTASYKVHDGEIEGRKVQIKATQGDSIALSSEPDYLLVLKISKEGVAKEIYNGPGKVVWDLVKDKPTPKNGQFQIGSSKLRLLMKEIPGSERIKRINL